MLTPVSLVIHEDPDRSTIGRSAGLRSSSQQSIDTSSIGHAALDRSWLHCLWNIPQTLRFGECLRESRMFKSATHSPLSYIEICVSRLYASMPLDAEGPRTHRGPSHPVNDMWRDDPSNIPPARLPSNGLWFTTCHFSIPCSRMFGLSGANMNAIPGMPTLPIACDTAQEARPSGGIGSGKIFFATNNEFPLEIAITESISLISTLNVPDSN
ncbi:hypothetical protein BJX70DRAFT_341087 [Aspergillus crustosus]